MEGLFISEIFASIQGEGSLSGVPSVFVRTSGCNLRCDWCDTPYTSWDPVGKQMPLEAIVREVTDHTSIRHTVLTGGEPMIAKSLAALCTMLKEQEQHITVETAGTVFQKVSADLFSISPKLSNSRPQRGSEVWKKRHDKNRLQPDVIGLLMDAADYQLKFVVSHQEDLGEIEALLEVINPDPSKVLLMPEGRCTERLDEGATWIVRACMERGWRFCDRLHVRLFGDTRGT